MRISVHAAVSFWCNRRQAGRDVSAVKPADENGGVRTVTRSGRAQKRSMVSPANAAEKSSQPTGIPTGSIAVMSVSSVTGIGAERSQPRLQG